MLPRQGHPILRLTAGVCFAPVSIAVSAMRSAFGRNAAWVTLHIRMEDDALTKRLFDEVEGGPRSRSSGVSRARTGIGSGTTEFGFSTINLRRDGCSIDDQPEKLAETREWMLEYLPKLKEVMGSAPEGASWPNWRPRGPPRPRVPSLPVSPAARPGPRRRRSASGGWGRALATPGRARRRPVHARGIRVGDSLRVETHERR